MSDLGLFLCNNENQDNDNKNQGGYDDNEVGMEKYIYFFIMLFFKIVFAFWIMCSFDCLCIFSDVF